MQYLGPLAWETFGQRRNDEELRIKLTGITIGIDGHHATDDEQRAARAWMSRRLEKLGLMTGRLVIRYDRVTVDVATGDEVARVMLDQVVIDLD
ncbi:MAG: hypothetical protein CL424_14765 [Acidimicrobiaceae bacterium]|nr:hypothetical protein [Acidimicrobiaceae bacterium]